VGSESSAAVVDCFVYECFVENFVQNALPISVEFSFRCDGDVFFDGQSIV
jgi:hypothetical protein